MVYRFLYYFANVLLRVYFRKIYIRGLEHIPKDQALIIVCNHPMGFIEPIIMACLFPLDLNFLVRGDLFEKKALRGLLLSTHQIPIYRFKDGFSSLRNNQETMNYVVEVMRKRQALVIFVEGSTKMIMHLRPLQKGMARMAMQSKQADPTLDIKVLPVGMTFTRGWSPLSEVVVNVGETFPINPIMNGLEEKEAMVALTDFTYQKVQDQMVHLTHEEDEDHVRSFLDLYHVYDRTRFFTRVVKSKGPNQYIKPLEAALNDEVKKQSLIKQISGLRAELKANGKLAMVSGLKNKGLFVLTLLPALIGIIFYFVPVYGAFFLRKKLVKQKEFISSIIAASGGGFTLIWLVLIFLILAVFTSISIALMAIPFEIVVGICALYFFDSFQRIEKMPPHFNEKFERLIATFLGENK